MEYFKSLEFYILYLYLECVVKLIKVVTYLQHFWNKIVLRRSLKGSSLKYPYIIKDVDGEMKQKFFEDFNGKKSGLIQVGTEKWVLPAKFRDHAENVHNFNTRSNDTWIVTFPRSGTTWVQELIWLISNDLDFKSAKYVPLTRRFPFLDLHWFLDKDLSKDIQESIKEEKWKTNLFKFLSYPSELKFSLWLFPRFIKTHLPIELLPKNIMESGTKIVYVARNPKDMLVSYYHLNKLWRSTSYTNDFDTFYNYFENDQLYWCPYWTHLKQAWALRDKPNVLFLFYEEMIKDLPETIKKISTFLKKPIREEDIPLLINHLSIENFKTNTSLNMQEGLDLGILVKYSQGFVRNGKNGSYKEQFTPDLVKRADRWIEKNLKDTDLRFPE